MRRNKVKCLNPNHDRDAVIRGLNDKKEAAAIRLAVFEAQTKLVDARCDEELDAAETEAKSED